MADLSKSTNNHAEASPLAGQEARGVPLVLVVEDHDDTRFMLRYLMEMRGRRVIEAADGEEAVHLAETMHPDLILMDTHLPRLDGLSAMRRMRDLAALRNVPILFLSGHAQPQIRALALATGGDDYLTKPFNLGELELAVERHLGKSEAARPT
jgi:DNA-binding response OmpR family regulator